MPDARVFQLNAGPGGVPKRAVAHAHVGTLGLTGDAVRHPKIHGGPERAVCLYSLENILALQQEGHPVFPGALGENITTLGVDFADLRPGDRLRVGDALLEVTRYTTPCATIAPFLGGQPDRVHHDKRPGWSRVYAKVLRAGRLAPGSPIAREPSAQTRLPDAP